MGFPIVVAIIDFRPAGRRRTLGSANRCRSRSTVPGIEAQQQCARAISGCAHKHEDHSRQSMSRPVAAKHCCDRSTELSAPVDGVDYRPNYAARAPEPDSRGEVNRIRAQWVALLRGVNSTLFGDHTVKVAINRGHALITVRRSHLATFGRDPIGQVGLGERALRAIATNSNPSAIARSMVVRW